MNTWEIDENAERYGSHPVLGKAARFLVRFRDLIDRSSDGWAYWGPPVQSCRRLFLLFQDPETATDDQLKKAMAPVKSFCTRYRTQCPNLNLISFELK